MSLYEIIERIENCGESPQRGATVVNELDKFFKEHSFAKKVYDGKASYEEALRPFAESFGRFGFRRGDFSEESRSARESMRDIGAVPLPSFLNTNYNALLRSNSKMLFRVGVGFSVIGTGLCVVKNISPLELGLPVILLGVAFPFVTTSWPYVADAFQRKGKKVLEVARETDKYLLDLRSKYEHLRK